jgi:hypothetical protein
VRGSRTFSIVAITASCAAIAASCAGGGGSARAPASLEHEAYLWQRAWTGAVREAVAAAPPEIGALRVLVAEFERDGSLARPDIDTAALTRPVTAVVRVDGARLAALPALDLAPVLATVAGWRRAGVDVRGLEIDHDCATAALGGYAAWLEQLRPRAPDLRMSITALPTWAGAPALRRVAAAVDEVVLQVHAVRAPRIFDEHEARRGIDAFARATAGTPLRIALPTYAVQLGGRRLGADPAEVARLLRSLEQRPVPAVRGVVWFRLPVVGDGQTWAAVTLAAVIRGALLAPDLDLHVVPSGVGRFDLVLENTGTLAAPWPPIRIDGGLVAADLVGGYVPVGRRSWAPPHREVAAGSVAIIGWVSGKDLDVVVP